MTPQNAFFEYALQESIMAIVPHKHRSSHG
jgi:hypothetical protein